MRLRRVSAGRGQAPRRRDAHDPGLGVPRVQYDVPGRRPLHGSSADRAEKVHPIIEEEMRLVSVLELFCRQLERAGSR
jgi:hypothetical protein